MKSLLSVIAALTVSIAVVEHAEAQVAHVTYFAPAVSVTTFYAPAPVPVTTFYAPAPAVAYQPVTVATTRYRPILGGTVTRFRTAFSPVVVNPMPVVYAY